MAYQRTLSKKYQSLSVTKSHPFRTFFSQKGNACGLTVTCSHSKLQLSSDTNFLPKMRDFLTNFPFRALSIFVTIVGSFTYNILLERDIQCTCKDVALDCSTYMFMPFCIIFFLILWTDKTLQRTCKYTFVCEFNNQEQQNQQCVRTQLCGVFWSRIFKAFSVGVLWVVSVLVDGDWYVCCESETEKSQLACKDKANITAEENVMINSLKNTSRVSFSFCCSCFFSHLQHLILFCVSLTDL